MSRKWENKKKLGAVLFNINGYTVRNAPKGESGVIIYTGKKVHKSGFKTRAEAMGYLTDKIGKEQKGIEYIKLDEFRRRLNNINDKVVLIELRNLGYTGNRKEMKEQIKRKQKGTQLKMKV